VDVVVAGVLVTDRQLVELTGDVVCRPGIHVPVRVDAIGVGGGRGCRLLGRPVVVLVEAFEAVKGRMALLSAELTKHALLERAAIATAIFATAGETAAVATSSSVAATAASSPSTRGVATRATSLGRHVGRGLRTLGA
jgi:hypothetical protein